MRIFDRIIGRLDEYVWTRGGCGNTRLARVWRGVENVREGQIIQESLDLFTLRIAPTPKFSKIDEEILKRNLVERVGTTEVRFEYVDHIPRNRSGKFKSVISRVDPPKEGIRDFAPYDEFT
jgi:phenylacetate-CoA ligase